MHSYIQSNSYMPLDIPKVGCGPLCLLPRESPVGRAEHQQKTQAGY